MITQFYPGSGTNDTLKQYNNIALMLIIATYEHAHKTTPEITAQTLSAIAEKGSQALTEEQKIAVVNDNQTNWDKIFMDARCLSKALPKFRENRRPLQFVDFNEESLDVVIKSAARRLASLNFTVPEDTSYIGDCLKAAQASLKQINPARTR